MTGVQTCALPICGTSTEELDYEVKLPLEGKTDKISTRIMELAPDNVTAVEWDQKKEKK